MPPKDSIIRALCAKHIPPALGPQAKEDVTFDVWTCPPSPRPVFIHPPTVLLTGRVSGPLAWVLPPRKCSAKYTEAAFSFCSVGRGRLRLKQHHVSRGSALNDGKGPWALKLRWVSEWVHEASSGQLGGVEAARKEQQELSPARGPEGGSSGTFSVGPPNSLSAQGLGTPPDGLAPTAVLPMQR